MPDPSWSSTHPELPVWALASGRRRCRHRRHRRSQSFAKRDATDHAVAVATSAGAVAVAVATGAGGVVVAVGWGRLHRMRLGIGLGLALGHGHPVRGLVAEGAGRRWPWTPSAWPCLARAERAGAAGGRWRRRSREGWRRRCWVGDELPSLEVEDCHPLTCLLVLPELVFPLPKHLLARGAAALRGARGLGDVREACLDLGLVAPDPDAVGLPLWVSICGCRSPTPASPASPCGDPPLEPPPSRVDVRRHSGQTALCLDGNK